MAASCPEVQVYAPAANAAGAPCGPDGGQKFEVPVDIKVFSESELPLALAALRSVCDSPRGRQLREVLAEIRDRYGELPPEVV